MRFFILAVALSMLSCLKAQTPKSEAQASVEQAAESVKDPGPVFYRIADGDLRVHFSKPGEVWTCMSPASGAFIRISYMYQGVWYADAGQTTITGGNRLNGDNILDEKYINISFFPLGPGCDVISPQTIPSQVTVPYVRNFKIVAQVGKRDIGPLTTPLEEWAQELGYQICEPIGVPTDPCYSRTSVESYYNRSKGQRGDGKGTEVFQTIQAESGILKLTFPYGLKEKPVEHIIKLDELPLFLDGQGSP